MKRQKMSQFTIDELNRVDQDTYFEELWFLRHVPAARRLFANMQTTLFEIDNVKGHEDYKDIEHGLCYELKGLATGLEELCCEAISHHPWWYNRLNPNRVFVPSMYSFMRLAEELGVESKPNEWGDETLFKTILGWWQY